MANWLKGSSVLVLIGGIILLGFGLYMYWNDNPVPNEASVFIMIGILFLLGAILMLCVSFEYDVVSDSTVNSPNNSTINNPA